MTLPTRGLVNETRLGRCGACEEFIQQTRALDLDLRREQVRQAKAEADRLEGRLRAEMFDDPRPQLPRVQVDLRSTTNGGE